MSKTYGKKKISGTVYDLSHLSSFVMHIPKVGGGGYRVRVDFGVHTFTEKYTLLHTPDLVVPDGKEIRAFCLKRYARSLSLRATVMSAAKSRVHLSNGNPIIAGPLPGRTAPYLVAFNITPQVTKKHDCVMTVVSAHERPGFQVAQLPSTPFKALISNALYDTKIDWTKK